MNGVCENCERAPVYAVGRCSACYSYRIRTGDERPARLYDRTQPVALTADELREWREYCQGVRARREAGEVEPWRVTV